MRNEWLERNRKLLSDLFIMRYGVNSNYGLALVGLGVSFSFDKHFDLRVEDTAYIPFSNTYTGSVNAVTGGVQYNF